jgi:hypothetical protein
VKSNATLIVSFLALALLAHGAGTWSYSGSLLPPQDINAVEAWSPISNLVPSPASRYWPVDGRHGPGSEPKLWATDLKQAAHACWSSELDEITDPVIRVRIGTNIVQRVIQIAQSGGRPALDREITQMRQEQEQARRGLRAANDDIAAIGEGLPPQISPRICATWRQTRDPNAIMAAMCQRVTMQNALHLANGLADVIQCVRQFSP